MHRFFKWIFTFFNITLPVLAHVAARHLAQ